MRDVGATCYSFGRGDADSCPSAPHARARGGRFGQCCRCRLPGWWRRVRGGEVGGVRGGRGGTDRGESPTHARGDRCRPGCGLPGCGLCAPQEALCQSRHSASCRRGHSPSPFRGGRTVPPPAAGARSLSRTLGRAGSTDRHGLLDGSKGPFLPWQTGTVFSYPRRGSNNIPDECKLGPVEHFFLSTYGRLPCRVHHGPFPAARVQAAGERGRTWILPRLLARRTRLRPPPQPDTRRRASRRRARSVRALTLARLPPQAWLSRSRASRPKHGAAARDSHTQRDSPSHTPSFAAQGSAPLHTSGWA